MSIAQFDGEDRKESIVNHLSLDIEEEDNFFDFIETMGYSIYDEDEIIENLCEMFRKSNPT